MNSGDPDMLLMTETRRFGLMLVEAGNVILPDVQPNAVAKRLATLVEECKLEKADYIRPRCYWHPYASHGPWPKRRSGYGAQALPRLAALLNYCLLGETRRHLCCRNRAAAVVLCGEEREAVFVDLNATPDHVARKLARYCDKVNTSGFAGITVLVPTQEKGAKVWRAAKKHDLPLPVSCVAIDDLRELLGL